ncbi:hypothetical protein [Arthrobacter sp. ok362]|nr:hypothetical protein [Arthrobacter sp. ok362]SDL94794.1 hypothetical protein SAMN04487913_11864 [Arthrobacter sp. ok362]
MSNILPRAGVDVPEPVRRFDGVLEIRVPVPEQGSPETQKVPIAGT